MTSKKLKVSGLHFFVGIASSFSMLLFPGLIVQGYLLRKRLHRLPDAAGPNTGHFAGSGETIRLVAMGESTIAGVGAFDHASALTGQTAKALNTKTQRPIQWHAIGKSGATVQTARRELVDLIPEGPVDLVVLVFGVNDIIEVRSIRRWISDMDQLILEIRARVGRVPIFLAAVPDLGQFPAFPQPLKSVLGLRALAFDCALARFAIKKRNVVHCPVTLNQPHEKFFCSDQVHPSVQGYEEWGGQIATFIDRVTREGYVQENMNYSLRKSL